MRRVAGAGALGAILLLSACGADSPDESSTIGSRALLVPADAPQGSDAVSIPSDLVCPPIDGYDGPVADEGIGASAGGAIEVDAGDFFFAPTCVVNPANGTVSMTVTNSGGILHNVSVADQGIDVDVAAGETIVVDIAVGDEPLVFICKFHRTAGMVGAVVPAA